MRIRGGDGDVGGRYGTWVRGSAPPRSVPLVPVTRGGVGEDMAVLRHFEAPRPGAPTGRSPGSKSRPAPPHRTPTHHPPSKASRRHRLEAPCRRATTE